MPGSVLVPENFSSPGGTGRRHSSPKSAYSPPREPVSSCAACMIVARSPARSSRSAAFDRDFSEAPFAPHITREGSWSYSFIVLERALPERGRSDPVQPSVTATE